LIIVSKYSLADGWEGMERHTDLVSNALVHPSSIVLTLDRVYEENQFVPTQIERMEWVLSEQGADYKSLSQVNGSYDIQISAANSLKNHLPRIVQRLRQIDPIEVTENTIDEVTEKIIERVKQRIRSRITLEEGVAIHAKTN
jgi:hypothetical protein